MNKSTENKLETDFDVEENDMPTFSPASPDQSDKADEGDDQADETNIGKTKNVYDHTYVTPVPSRYGRTDEDENQTDSGDDSNHEEYRFPTRHSPYNLRPSHRTHVAKGDYISDCGEPNLKVVLSSGHRDIWLMATEEEFDVMSEHQTFF